MKSWTLHFLTHLSEQSYIKSLKLSRKLKIASKTLSFLKQKLTSKQGFINFFDSKVFQFCISVREHLNKNNLGGNLGIWPVFFHLLAGEQNSLPCGSGEKKLSRRKCNRNFLFHFCSNVARKEKSRWNFEFQPRFFLLICQDFKSFKIQRQVS